MISSHLTLGLNYCLKNYLFPQNCCQQRTFLIKIIDLKNFIIYKLRQLVDYICRKSGRYSALFISTWVSDDHPLHSLTKNYAVARTTAGLQKYCVLIGSIYPEPPSLVQFLELNFSDWNVVVQIIDGGAASCILTS